MNKVIFHIDVNSAYLSWSAADMLQKGYEIDIRNIPSVIGGNERSRNGIVLAKSVPAKKYNIKTGETLRDAFKKCPSLVSFLPNYSLYMKASTEMFKIINEFSPIVQRFSIDECFLDYTNMEHHFGSPLDGAFLIKEKIKKELGFTVNIGISNNKILAKMASGFKKPDNIHTLYKEELPFKLWHLPVNELFMVGSKTNKKLNSLGINTIGDLATAKENILYSHLKSHGLLIKNYANGIDDSIVKKSNQPIVKGMGNSTTIPFDVESKDIAYKVILSLVENISMRLRNSSLNTNLVGITIGYNNFLHKSHQKKLDISTDSTNIIYCISKNLFDELWDKTPIRKISIRVSELCNNEYTQISIFEDSMLLKYKAIDSSIDEIRKKFGNASIYRASFLHSNIPPVTGGIGEENYPVMTSIL